MPLPDERPRQSVANLIGKFETQSKHLSPSQSNPSRSSSVVSHVTGDSAKEDNKEKREWPPRSLLEKTPPGPSRLMPIMIDVHGRKVLVKSETEAFLANPVLQYIQDQQEAENEPNTFLENWRKDLPQSTDMEPELATPKPREEPPAAAPPVQKVISAPQMPKTPVMKTSAPKIPTSISSKSVGTPAKAQAKPASKLTPPKQSLTPANSAKPLKPQLTGQSIVSSASRRTISKVVTPAKPSARTETGTKTPTLSPRSKTPSSGLFAPTAASLAKARNALPPPPPPVKKTTMSGDAMDRLSRPTAASLSRAKTGPASPTPKSPPRISSVKSKPTMSSSKSPQTKVKKEAAAPQAPGGSNVVLAVANVGVTLSAAEPAPEEAPAEPTTNGHHDNEPEVADTTYEVEQTRPEAAVVLGKDAESDNESSAPPQTLAAPESESEAYDLSISAEVEEAPTTNLEDIVSLLETTPVTSDFTEEISEIPDVDDK